MTQNHNRWEVKKSAWKFDGSSITFEIISEVSMHSFFYVRHCNSATWRKDSTTAYLQLIKKLLLPNCIVHICDDNLFSSVQLQAHPFKEMLLCNCISPLPKSIVDMLTKKKRCGTADANTSDFNISSHLAEIHYRKIQVPTTGRDCMQNLYLR